ncbi:hypothetical protein FRC17_000956 [Serendipita sp. 399]|nr:hypothetical protein FRC17_000956 [Serendipita sp. 399]
MLDGFLTPLEIEALGGQNILTVVYDVYITRWFSAIALTLVCYDNLLTFSDEVIPSQLGVRTTLCIDFTTGQLHMAEEMECYQNPHSFEPPRLSLLHFLEYLYTHRRKGSHFGQILRGHSCINRIRGISELFHVQLDLARTDESGAVPSTIREPSTTGILHRLVFHHRNFGYTHFGHIAREDILLSRIGCELVLPHIRSNPNRSQACGIAMRPSTMGFIWLAPLIFETTTFVLTIRKLYKNAAEEYTVYSKLITTLYRDGVCYYLVIIGLRIFNLLAWLVMPVQFALIGIFLLWAVMSISVTRLQINLIEAAQPLLLTIEISSVGPSISVFAASALSHQSDQPQGSNSSNMPRRSSRVQLRTFTETVTSEP